MVTTDSDGPVEVCVPVSHPPQDPAELAWRVEPAHREAFIPVTKTHFEVPAIFSIYDQLARWVTAPGRRRAGADARPHLDPPAEVPPVIRPVPAVDSSVTFRVQAGNPAGAHRHRSARFVSAERMRLNRTGIVILRDRRDIRLYAIVVASNDRRRITYRQEG